ncbi:piggyBac transposable element-derived protein 3-like isoform X1 [Nilaparvata lugens]|uniref:piggyBac transposable element-derived protein 3-like isoform X1 n=1 Tax=Nilaparvata lugens TaxID=108931 RepID=UPI00193E6136|nr:piggyBac transposable element-derived protein 3-like isoform X1 [Nilaparvata lugens]
MRQNRFIQILNLLHFADNNNINPSDKLWKLRPFIEKLPRVFRDNFVPVQQLAYDESMIAYFGRHSCKQFIRGKPIRFGYKVCCLNTFNGYLVVVEVYQDKSVHSYDKDFGKAAAPMVRMLNELGPKKDLPYHLYFDNLFTDVDLLVHLRENHYQGTGTIRMNRVPKDCSIISMKDIKSKERGFVSNDNILIARWQDNAPVTVASTIHGINPIVNVNRYSKREKKTVLVKRPYLISEYNKFMGGTDLMDENINCYRVSVRSKKWWWSIFSWCFDVCYQNAWHLYNMSHLQKMSQLEFKRNVAVFYLKTLGIQPQVGGRRSMRPQAAPAFEDLWYDRLDHFIIQNEGNKRRRCAGPNCTGSVRTGCQKCNVGLCIPCFMEYHTKK